MNKHSAKKTAKTRVELIVTHQVSELKGIIESLRERNMTHKQRYSKMINKHRTERQDDKLCRGQQ